ncbi:DUF2207 domain-containing protein [candidate division KSB1 bacterium]|nr:DUF2207 domain-containing protein [candidate division KSB1 bacterium]
MYGQKRIIFYLWLFVIFFFTLNSNLIASPQKHFALDEIQIDAKIASDGSLLISEQRGYTFRGSFTWADYELPLKKLGRVTDFSLSEGSMNYEPMPGDNPGAYQIRQTNDEFYVKWHYQARDETRIFKLQYRVEDAVNIYQDVAEFYYKFVGENTETKIGNIAVTITLPQPADTSQVRAWAHGPLHGQLEFREGKIRLWVSPLPKRNFWEVRIIFPNDWISAAMPRQDRFMRDQIMNEERLLVERSNARRLAIQEKSKLREQYKDTALQGSWLIALVGLLVFWFLYNRYGKSHQVPVYGTLSSEIPENMAPAVANYIYTIGQPGAGAMVATMLDLARRGFLKIEEQEVENRSIFGKSKKIIYSLKLNNETFQGNKEELLPLERDMIDFIFATLAKGAEEIQLEDLKKSSSQVQKWFKNWKRMIEDQWGERSFYEKSSVHGVIISVLISILMIVLGIFIAIYFGVSGAIVIVAGILMCFLSFAILTYTRDVKFLRVKLLALKKYLRNFHVQRDPGNWQSNIEQFLVYAVTLGISSAMIKKMLASIPEWQGGAYFAWYGSTLGHGSPSNFSGAIASMITATSTTMGSAAGVGGGASAAAGAGAGGASGGAG